MAVAALTMLWSAADRGRAGARPGRLGILARRLAVGCCLAGWLGAAGCASGAQYNPGRLPADQISNVESVCVDVMGMRKFEAVGPAWALDDGRPYSGRWENHYQGCIDGLSDTLRDMNIHNNLLRADEACRLIDPTAESPVQAKCVLSAANSNGRLIDLAMAGRTRGTARPPATGLRLRPFYTVSNAEKLRREQSACAAIGQNPAFSGFTACVNHLSEIFYAIDYLLH